MFETLQYENIHYYPTACVLFCSVTDNKWFLQFVQHSENLSIEATEAPESV